MNILIAKTFGIGNAVCAVPMIKAIRKANPDARIHVLVGNHSDDFGSWDVFVRLTEELKLGLFTNVALNVEYDVAVLSIPYDGRWKNGVHFSARRVIDGRGRPEHSQVFGFSSWKKHEVEYQMENAYELGYTGETPDCSFFDPESHKEELSLSYPEKTVYLGVGYKKDAAGFWKQKHWGNENFAALVKMLLDSDSRLVVTSTGDITDMQLSMGPIKRLVNNDRYVTLVQPLAKSFVVMASAGSYVGNDTGMAHVAASMGKKVAVVFKMENASTKSRPWCKEYRVIEGTGRDVSPKEMFDTLQEMRNG